MSGEFALVAIALRQPLIILEASAYSLCVRTCGKLSARARNFCQHLLGTRRCHEHFTRVSPQSPGPFVLESRPQCAHIDWTPRASVQLAGGTHCARAIRSPCVSTAADIRDQRGP